MKKVIILSLSLLLVVNTQLLLTVVSGEDLTFNIGDKFVSSGWMGDGEFGTKYIKLNEGCKDNPYSKPTCIRVEYHPGINQWGGIYWQNKPGNWGSEPGENFSKMKFKKITFMARGENGDEIIEFKAGGIKGKYRDSFEVSVGKVNLEKNWVKYTIDLKGMNLSSVIGGFCWVASGSANPNGAVFYLDDIVYEK
jgi:hypothetical protein